VVVLVPVVDVVGDGSLPVGVPTVVVAVVAVALVVVVVAASLLGAVTVVVVTVVVVLVVLLMVEVGGALLVVDAPGTDVVEAEAVGTEVLVVVAEVKLVELATVVVDPSGALATSEGGVWPVAPAASPVASGARTTRAAIKGGDRYRSFPFRELTTEPHS
jgi:hypothetical protein